jgi:hypothetical protein
VPPGYAAEIDLTVGAPPITLGLRIVQWEGGMGSDPKPAPGEAAEALLDGLRGCFEEMAVEIARLRDTKAALEADLARSKKKVDEQATELASLKQKLAKADSTVIASAHRKKFHRLSCEYAGDIWRSDHAKYYLNREQAIAAGYKPCATCCS